MADFNLEALVNQVVEKLTGSKTKAASFKKDPVAAVKGILGNIDLDDGIIGKIVEAVKGKINLDELTEKVGGLKGLLSKAKGLFGKKK